MGEGERESSLFASSLAACRMQVAMQERIRSRTKFNQRACASNAGTGQAQDRRRRTGTGTLLTGVGQACACNSSCNLTHPDTSPLAATYRPGTHCLNARKRRTHSCDTAIPAWPGSWERLPHDWPFRCYSCRRLAADGTSGFSYQKGQPQVDVDHAESSHQEGSEILCSNCLPPSWVSPVSPTRPWSHPQQDGSW